jgi:hypothetical protein
MSSLADIAAGGTSSCVMIPLVLPSSSVLRSLLPEYRPAT